MIIKAFDAKLLQVLRNCQNHNTSLEVKVCNKIGELGILKGKISKESIIELFDGFRFAVEYENEQNIETMLNFFPSNGKEANNFLVLGIKNGETGEAIFENQKVIPFLQVDPQLISVGELEEIKNNEKGKTLLKNIGSLVTIKNEDKDEIKGMLESVNLGSDGNVYASVRVKPNMVACAKVDEKTNLSFKRCCKNNLNKDDDFMMIL